MSAKRLVKKNQTATKQRKLKSTKQWQKKSTPNVKLASRKLAKMSAAFFLCVGAVMAMQSAFAQSATQYQTKQNPVRTVTPQDLSSIKVTQYELALVQVMAEICPKMLGNHQSEKFISAYENQLQAFMPKVKNPSEVMVYLSGQRDYRNVLKNVRSWTARFPSEDNKRLCREFIQRNRTF